MRDLADQLFDLTLEHHKLRPNLMGLRDDGVLQDHSEEADRGFLQRYQDINSEAERRTPETADDRIVQGLVRYLAQAECDTIESRAIEFGVSGDLSAPVPELLYFLPQLKSHHAVPRFLATVAERHRAGVEAGLLPVRHLVEQAIASWTGTTCRDCSTTATCSRTTCCRTAGTPSTRDCAGCPTAKRCTARRSGRTRRWSSIRTSCTPPARISSKTSRASSAGTEVARTPASTPPHYVAAAIDGSRPGTYFVNTKTRQRSIAEATAFHEAVPGHHFEAERVALLQDLPLLRRKARITAFSEGWALYAEHLADEMGLYRTEEARLGMFTMAAKRAGRLVADTGLHAKGWSRQQAVDHLLDHTPMPRELAEAEVDRYLAQPAQALAYMVGRLKFDELRTRAEQALGTAVDVRDFHEVVLGSGRLTLGLLDDVVTAWIAER